MRDLYLGIDVGSVSTNLVVVDGESRVTEQVYLRTNGRPIPTVQKGLAMIKKPWVPTGLVALAPPAAPGT